MNTVAVNSSENKTPVTNESDDVDADPFVNLTVSKSVNVTVQDVVLVGDKLKYTITVKNVGLSTASGVNVKFHDVIFGLTQNERLINLAHNLREQVYRYRVEYVKDFSYHDILVKEHYDITNAILMNDVATAKEIMRKHLYNQELIVIKILKDSL